MKQDTALLVQTATDPAEVAGARALIHDVYASQYGVRFTDDHEQADPSRRLEPWPHRYVVGRIDGTLVAAAGLYEGWTYTERFGAIAEEQIVDRLRERGAASHSLRPRVEYTKLVVHPDWTGLGLGRRFLVASHSRSFLCSSSSAPPPLLLACGKVSVFETLYRSVGMASVPIAPFPQYASHRRYHSAADGMESRLLLPEQDLPREWFDTELPLAVPFEARGGRVAV